MSEISNLSQAQIQALGLGVSEPEAQPSNELGQEEFFDLMVAQLKFQDPLKPVANTEFVAQMAEFSNVSALGDIQGSIADLVGAFQSNQALQASTLVGRDVLVPAGRAELKGAGAVSGALDLPGGSTSVSVLVLDGSGAVVRELPLGEQPAGRVPFTWDGLDHNGQRAPPGAYQFLAQGQFPEVEGGQGTGVETLLVSRVDSVSVRQSPPGVTLNLSGMEPADLADVQEFL